MISRFKFIVVMIHLDVQEFLVQLLPTKSAAEQLDVDLFALEGLRQLFVDDLVVLTEALGVLHHLLEHLGKELSRLVGLTKRVASDQLFKHWHVVLFRHSFSQAFIKELDPEPDQGLLLHLAGLKDAVEFEVGVPSDHGVAALNVEAVSHEDPLNN